MSIVSASLLLGVLSGQAHAQACMCSRSVALPSVPLQRAWAGVFSFEYGMNLEADPDTWHGFAMVDQYGDSMAGMYMPPMLVQTAALTATLGLPAHFSVSTTLPYMYKNNLGESEMPGDTDLASFNDVDVTGRWGNSSTDMKRFYGLSAGVTLPTGTVIPNSPVRSGRGGLGLNLALSGGVKVHPKVRLAGQVSTTNGFGPDDTGYVVAPSASFVGGAGWSPRENGKLSLALFGMERWMGKDRQDLLVYKNSGHLVTDIAAAASYTFWAKDVRSAGLSLRGQVPVYQIVGDPMYAENFGLSAGLSFTAF